MVEVETRDFAKKSTANTGLGFGIAGTALSLLNNGGIPNLLGGSNCGCSEDHVINRYEATQQAKIAELETEIKLRDANTFAMDRINAVRDYVDRRFEKVECQLSQQAVYNATNTAALNCMQGQIAQLMSLTKLVFPNGSVCPGWGDVTVTVTPTTTAAG